jgi:hypothetical protein
MGKKAIYVEGRTREERVDQGKKLWSLMVIRLRLCSVRDLTMGLNQQT